LTGPHSPHDHGNDQTLRWIPVPRYLHALTIAQRVRFGFLAGAVVVVIVSLAAALLIRLVTDTLENVVNQVRLEQSTVIAMKDAVSAENAGIQGYLITGDQAYLDAYNQAHNRFATGAALLGGTNASEADRADASEATALEAEFRRLAQQEIDLSAESFPNSAALLWQREGQQAEAQLSSRLDQIVARRVQNVNAELASAHRHEDQTRYVFIPIVVITALVGLLTAFVASRSITRRFAHLESTVEQIEQGDFQVEVPERRYDELGRLSRSIRDMAHALDIETREREQLLAERAQSNQELAALYDVARTVNQSLDTNEVLHLALSKLISHTQMRAGVALLKDEATGRFRVAAIEGLSEEGAADLTGFLEEDGPQEFAARAMASAEPTHIDLRNLSLDLRPFQSGIAMPLRAKGNNRGVLILATAAELRVSEAEARLVEGLSSQVATALEHAWLYSQSSHLAAIEERNRLARELHDSVSQSLFSMSMMSQALPSLITTKPERAVERATRLSDLARGALAEMRALILELRPDALREKGLVEALERYTAGFASRNDLQITFRVDGLQRRLPDDREDALFGIAREALNNVDRHAQACNVQVVLEFDPDSVALAVTDDGKGMAEPAPSGGFGFTSMRERAERLGGSVQVGPAPGHGVAVRARVPAPAPTTSIAG
jgi:signal transduction histidine kinase